MTWTLRPCYLLVLVLLVPCVAGGTDTGCTEDSGCWFRSVGEAAESSAGDQKPYSDWDCALWCLNHYGPDYEAESTGQLCSCTYNPGKKATSSPTPESRQTVAPLRTVSCDQDCKTYAPGRVYGANATGTGTTGMCQCSCKQGYVPNKNMECVSVDDAAWESFMGTCRDLRGYSQGGGETFVVTQQELVTFLKKVEKANPDYSWAQIVAALHVALYNNDALEQKLPILNVPLFAWGPETDGWEDVDLLCRAPTGVSNPPWYIPKFVRADNGEITELGHAYGALRVNLNREPGIWQDTWVQIITHWGDRWQQIIHNWILREEGDRYPPDQYRGNDMGIWLEKYYRTHPYAPLSEAFQAYFSRF
ncbi:hypothetical protein DSECCO2_486960 [anaerobic digester metagenome]